MNKKIIHWENIEPSGYTNIVFPTFWYVIMLYLKDAILLPIIIMWGICLIIAYYLVIRTILCRIKTLKVDYKVDNEGN